MNNKLVINEDGKVEYNGTEIKKQEINSDFLRKIFILFLQKNLELEIKEEAEIAYVFKKMQEEAREGTPFYNSWMQKKQEFEKATADIEELQKSIQLPNEQIQ